MRRRLLPYAIAGLVAAMVLAGWGLISLASDSGDTASKVDATATKVAAEPSHRAAADEKLREQLARAEVEREQLREQIAREAVERERLRQLVIANGGDPGPDLTVTVVNPRQSDPPARSSPAPSGRPSPTARASPSPSPSCRVPLPVVGCPR